MPALYVHLLPQLMSPGDLTRGTAVVIDILRATSTVVHALAEGAEAVIPCLTVEEAQNRAAELAAETRLLGGERQGKLIAGFDLDNSPLAYVREKVGGKVIVFTTTNGTRALLKCREASPVLLGAFVNLSAVAGAVEQRGRDAHLVCAGTDDQLTAEDLLFAGVLVQELQERSPGRWRLGNVSAELVLEYSRAKCATEELFCEAFAGGPGGKNLLELGLRRDIDRCRERNLYSLVPVWDPLSGRIEPLRGSA